MATIVVGVVLAMLSAGSTLGALDARVIGFDNADKRGAMYLHDQLHQALGEGRLPTFDTHQLFPIGVALAPLNGYNVLEMLPSGVFRWVAPWPLWFNLGHLVWIPLNLLGFLPLGLHLFGSRDAALAAGAAWVMSPWYLHEIAAGRLTQVVLFALPLAVLGWLRLMEDGRPQDRILAGVGLGLLGISFWYYAYFLALLLPLFLLVRRRPWGAVLRDSVVAGSVALVVAGPLLLAVMWPRLTGEVAPMPPAEMLLQKRHYESALQVTGAQPEALAGWFSWVLLPGLVCGLLFGGRGETSPVQARSRQRRWLWLALIGVTLLAALGPFQRIGGQLYRLPYAVMWEHLPLLSRLTNPGRWVGVAMLPLVVLAVGGLLVWARRPASAATSGGSAWGWARAGLVWVIPLGVILQLQAREKLGMGGYDARPPAVWADVAEHARGALIVVPVLFDAEACGWALFHQQPVLGGMVASLPWAWPAAFRTRVEQNGLLMQMFGLGWGRDGEIQLHTDDLASLHADGFRHVVWDQASWARVRPERKTPDPRSRLRAALGEPRFEDELGAWWDLPERGAPGRATAPAGLQLPPP